MIRVPDNIVDVQQEIPPNGAELERNKVRVPVMLKPIPMNRNKQFRAASIQNENQLQYVPDNQIDEPPQHENVDVNAGKPVLVAANDKNESKPVANNDNAPPLQNSLNLPVPSALNHTTEQKVAESKITTGQNVLNNVTQSEPNNTATANVAPSNSTNANISSATIDGNTKIDEKGGLNGTQTNSTDLNKELETTLIANVTTSFNATEIASNKTIKVFNSPLIKAPISNHQAVNLPNIIDDGTGSSSNQSRTSNEADNNAQ